MQKKISLIGAGLHIDKHITMEAASALQQADAIFHLSPCHEYLTQFGEKVEDLFPLYTSTTSTSVYHVIVDRIIKSAEEGKKTVFLTYGHPLIYVDSSHMIIDKCNNLDIEVRVIAGISSIDVIIERLRFDPAFPGLQVYDANSLVCYKMKLNPHAHTLLMQIDAYGSNELRHGRKNHPDRYESLQIYLQKFYDPSHNIELLAASYSDAYADSYIKSELKDLSTLYNRIHLGMTMYIAPYGKLSIVSTTVLSQPYLEN